MNGSQRKSGDSQAVKAACGIDRENAVGQKRSSGRNAPQKG